MPSLTLLRLHGSLRSAVESAGIYAARILPFSVVPEGLGCLIRPGLTGPGVEASAAPRRAPSRAHGPRCASAGGRPCAEAMLLPVAGRSCGLCQAPLSSRLPEDGGPAPQPPAGMSVRVKIGGPWAPHRTQILALGFRGGTSTSTRHQHHHHHLQHQPTLSRLLFVATLRTGGSSVSAESLLLTRGSQWTRQLR